MSLGRCTVRAVLTLAWIAFAPLAGAQLRVQLPLGGAVNQVSQLGNQVVNTADGITNSALADARRLAQQTLLRQNPRTLEADPNGAPMLRAELLAVDLPAEALPAITAAGFTVESNQILPGLDLLVTHLRAPPRQSTRRALATLRQLWPSGSFDYDHLYSASAAEVVPTSMPSNASPSLPPAVTRVGLIDGGVRTEHPVFQGAHISLWGCDDKPVPSLHGTAVASLLIGQSGAFRGAGVGDALYAADVYCGQPTGGRVDWLVAALGWMAQNAVPVVNISLVGPDNLVLRQAVQRLVARGYLLVAAVGNDGPAAPPLYPAAYPGVVGVTAVDEHRHVLVEAGRGPQVMFAAPGADMAAATMPDGYAQVRGTSFAAPLVAALLASKLNAPDAAAAGLAVAGLAHDAVDLGATGRDPVYGFGLVAESLRVPADIMHAHPLP